MNAPFGLDARRLRKRSCGGGDGGNTKRTDVPRFMAAPTGYAWRCRQIWMPASEPKGEAHDHAVAVDVRPVREVFVRELEPWKEDEPVLGEEREPGHDLKGEAGADLAPEFQGQVLVLQAERPRGPSVDVGLQPPLRELRVHQQWPAQAALR